MRFERNIRPIRPSSYQANFDRLNTMAQKGPLSQTNQRNLAFYQKRLGVTPQVPPGNVQQVSGGAPFTPQAGGPQLPGATPQGGPISGPGAPIPAGPGPGRIGSGNPLIPANYTGTGSSIGGSAAGTPAAMNAMMKKGGKVKVKKMASGGMTSKVSSASSRADGIAQRGKTKCKIC